MAANGVGPNLVAPEPMPKPVEELPPMGAYANQFLRGQTAAIQAGISAFPNATRTFIKTMPDSLYRLSGPDDPKDIKGKFNVAIVGAGCAGLFTAMILNYLNNIPALKEAGLNLTYEILEANGPERLGGRLYTYKFPKLDENDVVGDHEYYDVGGMRFPDNPLMQKTFQLFNLLGMTSEYKDDDWAKWKRNIYDKAKTAKEQADLILYKQPPIAKVPAGQLIPYYISGKNVPMIFNGVRAVQPDTKDFMCAKDFQIDGLPGRVLTADPGAMVEDFVQEYRVKLHEDGPKAFWDLLQQKGDAFSVRQYLTNWARYDYNTIEFLETMNFGNRWYDQAFSEMVAESLDFDYALSGERVFWWCVMGGAQNLPRTMAKPPPAKDKSPSNDAANSLQDLNVQFGKKVTKIGYNWSKDPEWILPKVEVTCKGENTARTYDAVFNSTTLGIQQQMQLEGLKLNWGTKQAIRSLGYGASSKVGIRFKTHWWRNNNAEDKDLKELGLTFDISRGGVAHTDESIGFCVYPSYNIEDSVDKPGVLLASYNWSQAAQRLSGLIDRSSPKNEERLKEVLLDDLARLHAPPDKFDAMYKFLESQYLDHYALDWYHEETSVGAFAFFGPGQFKNMWPWIIRSNGTYMMIGEAASSRHAWVVGALESAVRAVYQFLWVRSRTSYACSEAAKLFVRKQTPPPDDKNPALSDLFLGLPTEFSRTDDIKAAGSTEESSPIGEFLRQGVFAEVCRLLQGHDQVGDVPLKDISEVLPKYSSSGTQT